ncbi:g2268 [Coccomyxa elongata]
MYAPRRRRSGSGRSGSLRKGDFLCNRGGTTEVIHSTLALQGVIKDSRDALANLLPMERPPVEPVRQGRWSAFSHASTRPCFDSAREALDMSTISFDKPSGHKPGHVVQSIHSLLRSDSRELGSGRSSSLKQRGRSCELPRGPCSGCPMLPTIASRQNSAPDSLPSSALSRQGSGCIPSFSRQRSGCITPPKAAAATAGCPVIPGLTWKKHIGSGSFARVYRGEWDSMQVAIKVLSSQANEANMSADLFESLLSANMHHPNVVETYEVLTVEPPAHEKCPMNSGRSGSLQGVLARSGSASSLAEAAAQASKLDSIASFFANQRDQQELRGILDRAGMFLETRTTSQPLPLSPFDSAISRAFTSGSEDLDAGKGHAAELRSEARVATAALIGIGAAAADGAANAAAMPAADRGKCGGPDTAGDQRGSCDLSSCGCGAGGACGGPSASALIGIARHAADAAASPPAERGFRRCCGEGGNLDNSRPFTSCACCGEGTRAVPCDCVPIQAAAARPPPGPAPVSRRSFEGRSCSITSQYNMQSLASGETTRASSIISVNTANGGSLMCNSAAELSSSWRGSGSMGNSRMGSLASSLPNRVAPIAEQPPLSPLRPLPPLPGLASRGGSLGGAVPIRDPIVLVEATDGLHLDVDRWQQPLVSVVARAGSDAGRTAGGTPPHLGGSPIPAPPPPPPPRQPQVLLLMELGDQRSLHTAISKGRLAGNLEAILLCAMDIAAGMEYLHSMGIIHADLKPANVLLMSAPATADDPRGFTCKASTFFLLGLYSDIALFSMWIADFGMSQVLTGESSYVPVADTHGSLPYVAPEVLHDGEVAKRADVYSFAMLLLEMWSGKVAYSEDNYHSVLFSVFSGRRPNIPDDIPPEYCALMKDCWSNEPKRRPTFAAAHARLCAQLGTLRGNLTPKQAALLASLGNRRIHSTA